MASKWKENSRKWELEQIAKASYFTACAFLGRGRFDVREASSLEEVRELKAEMLREYEGSNYGRGVLIYAVVVGTGSILVE